MHGSAGLPASTLHLGTDFSDSARDVVATVDDLNPA